MKNPNDIEAEVDAIRDKIFKTTQKMSAQERVEYINSRAHQILKKQQQSSKIRHEELGMGNRSAESRRT